MQCTGAGRRSVLGLQLAVVRDDFRSRRDAVAEIRDEVRFASDVKRPEVDVGRHELERMQGSIVTVDAPHDVSVR